MNKARLLHITAITKTESGRNNDIILVLATTRRLEGCIGNSNESPPVLDVPKDKIIYFIAREAHGRVTSLIAGATIAFGV